MGDIFKPEIKNKNCKHTWKKLKTKASGGGFFSKIEVEFEYLFCPKCKSTAGDPITIGGSEDISNIFMVPK